jgi:predicted Zn-dependent protease
VNLTTISYPDKGKNNLPFNLNVLIGPAPSLIFSLLLSLLLLSSGATLPALSASSQLQPVLKAIDPSLAKYDTSKPTDQTDNTSPNPGGTVNGAPLTQPHYKYTPYDDSHPPEAPSGYQTPQMDQSQGSYPAPQMVQPQSSGGPQEPSSGMPPSGSQPSGMAPQAPNGFLTGIPAPSQERGGMPQAPNSGFPDESSIPAFNNKPLGGQNQSPKVAPPKTNSNTNFGSAQPPLAPSISDLKRLARLEQAVFGASYPEHDFVARLDHVEKEALGKVTAGTPTERISHLEANVGSNQAAFDNVPAPDNTAKTPSVTGFGNADITRVIQAIPTKKSAGDYFNNVKPITGDGYARWTHFPIRIRLPQDSPETWRKEMEAGVEKWNHIIPIKVASPQELADIEVVWVNHLVPRLLGITRLIVVNGSPRVQMYILRPTFYLLAVPERCLSTAFTHELGHALGLYGHSGTPGDIMYPVELNIDGRLSMPPNATISPRDINTLKKIYESPALPGNVNLPRPLEWGFEAFPLGEKTCPF